MAEDGRGVLVDTGVMLVLDGLRIDPKDKTRNSSFTGTGQAKSKLCDRGYSVRFRGWLIY